MTNRIAIVDQNKCNPKKCNKECIKYCPPQSRGVEVINIVDIEDSQNSQNIQNIQNIQNNQNNKLTKKQIAQIVEQNCIGCNLCIKKCPFEAIKIINLPMENKNNIIHRYNINGFRLYKLPELKQNMIIGIVGENGIGKTTLINILTKTILPNFECFDAHIEHKDIITKFRGSTIYTYLQKLYADKLTITIKSQKLTQKLTEETIQDYLKQNNILLDNKLIDTLELRNIVNSNTETNKLSGGELQRLLCLNSLSTKSDVYIFDEPTNYLDIKQRLIITKLIRQLIEINENAYVIVIDHDLSMLDYMCDELYIMFGKSGAYGIISNPLSVFDGINTYLDGYIPNENIRFRDYQFNLKPVIELDKIQALQITNNVFGVEYPEGIIEYPNFQLHIKKNKIKLNSTINVILGENGVGKTTFIKYLAQNLKITVSYKEQTLSINKYKINETFPTVEELFFKNIHISYTDTKFIHEIVKPLDIDEIKNRKLNELSGGELQKVMIILCLGTPADIYLIDEPSANLDIEKRLKTIKLIKNFVMNNNKCAYIIEHDIMMCVSFAQEYTSNIILINKRAENNVRISEISDHLNFHEGITQFLKSMDITMRISNHNRPRINKYKSQLDKEQRLTDNYYL
jgi:ATP-binding cassette subfamily E protein 1